MEETNFSDGENLIQTAVDDETNANDSDDNDKFNDYFEGGWISWFCSLEGNEFFIEINEEFIYNRSNLLKLTKIKNYQ